MHYKPPAFCKKPTTTEVLYDFTKHNEDDKSSPNKSTSKATFDVMTTSYTLFIIAFIKSLIGKINFAYFFKSGREVPSHIIEIPPQRELEEHPLNPNSTLLLTAQSEELEDKKQSPEVSHTPPSDLSIISVSSKHYNNLYESMFEDESSDDDIKGEGQYGTNLTINHNENYFHNDWTANSIRVPDFPTLLPPDELYSDILEPLDEYDVAISKFYTPFRPIPKANYTVTDAVISAIPSTFLTSFLKKERDSIQELITKERTATKSAIKPLNREQLQIVELYWRSGRSSLPVVSAFSIDITCKDLLTLADRQWLNDNVIDFYLNLVAESNELVYCWTTHFFTTLKKNGYKGVARWAKRRKINVMEMKTIVVPINSMNTHWAVAIIDNALKAISYYDSLSSNGNLPAVELLEQYMLQEAERLNVPTNKYSLYPNMSTPQQQNGYDCGVFTCTVAKCVAQKAPLLFSQKDMQNIRRKMAFEIVQKSLLPEGITPNL